MPPPGTPAEELLIARFRSHARRLFWSALVLIAVFGVTAYFFLVAVVIPFIVWYSRTPTLTTRRVIAAQGLGSRHRREMSHARGYTIGVRRGPLQRMWGCGTITLSNGVDAPLRLVNVPNVTLVHEPLADQIEVGQILAPRDAQASGGALS